MCWKKIMCESWYENKNEIICTDYRNIYINIQKYVRRTLQRTINDCVSYIGTFTIIVISIIFLSHDVSNKTRAIVIDAADEYWIVTGFGKIRHNY